MHRNNAQELFLYFIIISLLIINVIVNVIPFTRCKPVQAVWNPDVQGRCLNHHLIRNLAIFQGGIWNHAEVFVCSYLSLTPVSLVHLRRCSARALPHLHSIQSSDEIEI